MISAILLSLTLSTFVSAHGWLNDVVIGSTQTIVGNVPNASPTATVIRQINNVDPVKGASNPFLTCGQDAQVASDVATVNPGDTVQFKWVNGEAGPWVHNVGPMQTYMASCGSQSCNSSSFNATAASWFKIQEQARVPGTTDNTWFMSFMNSGAPANVTIPANIAPGNYLLRHELIALQIAQTEGGAEFYPACVQVAIGGNGTGAPTEDETVLLPGAYNDTEPGLLIDVYDDTTATYIFPGPPVAAFVTGNTTTTTASASTTDSDSDSDSTAGSCMSSKKKRRSTIDLTTKSTKSRNARRNPIVETPFPRSYPGKISRVMKPLVVQ